MSECDCDIHAHVNAYEARREWQGMSGRREEAEDRRKKWIKGTGDTEGMKNESGPG